MPMLTLDVPATHLNHSLWLATALLGVTFPFLSYGGSSMLANGFMLAIINSIRKKLA